MRPPLTTLPLTEAQKTYHRTRTNDSRPACAKVANQMKQLRTLLADGPVSCGEVRAILGVSYDQAKWVIRKLRVAGEIVKNGDVKWRLVEGGK